MGAQGYVYNLPIAHWGAATHAADTLTPQAAFTQMADYQHVRCGSIPFDTYSGTGIAVTHDVQMLVDIPANHILYLELYDVTNSNQIATDSRYNLGASSILSYFVMSSAGSWGNFPSGDALVQPRYKLTLVGGGAGTANATFHAACWRIKRLT